MSRALIVLRGLTDRARAIRAIETCPPFSRVEIKGARRTLPQNDRMWAMLTDVSRQAKHHGRTYTPDQWKVLFLHAAGRELQFIPSLDGSTFLPWGQSSRDLSVAEMADLIECMFAWGAENGIAWSDPTLVGEPRGRAA